MENELNLPVPLDLTELEHDVLMAVFAQRRIEGSGAFGALGCFIHFRDRENSPLYEVTLQQWKDAERELESTILNKRAMLLSSLIEVKLLSRALSEFRTTTLYLDFAGPANAFAESGKFASRINHLVYGEPNERN